MNQRSRSIVVGAGMILLAMSLGGCKTVSMDKPVQMNRSSTSQVDQEVVSPPAESEAPGTVFTIGDRLLAGSDDQGWWIYVPSSTSAFQVKEVTTVVNQERTSAKKPPVLKAFEISRAAGSGEGACVRRVMSVPLMDMDSEPLELQTKNDRVRIHSNGGGLCGATLFVQPNKDLSYLVAKKPDPYERAGKVLSVDDLFGDGSCVDYALFDKKNERLELRLPSVLRVVGEGKFITEGGCDPSFPVFLSRIGSSDWIGASFSIMHEPEIPHFLFQTKTHEVKRLTNSPMGNEMTRDGRYWAVGSAGNTQSSPDELAIYDALTDRVVARKTIPMNRTIVKTADMFYDFYPMTWNVPKTIRYQTADRQLDISDQGEVRNTYNETWNVSF